MGQGGIPFDVALVCEICVDGVHCMCEFVRREEDALFLL